MARPGLIVAAVVIWCLLAPAWSGARETPAGGPAWARPDSLAPALSGPKAGAGQDRLPSRPDPPPAPGQRLWRFLTGGFLAALLWSRLFGYPLYGLGLSEGFPVGLLDVTVAATALYGGYVAVQRWWEQRAAIGRPTPRFSRPSKNSVPLEVEKSAQAGVERLTAQDPQFTLESFGTFVHHLIYEVHDAWNHQDLSRLNGKLSDNLQGFLEMGLKILALRREISRLEDLSLKRLAVVQAEVEPQRQTVTVWVEGQVLDYVLQSQTYKLLAGSMTYPTELRESWLFERPDSASPWRLQDIQDF